MGYYFQNCTNQKNILKSEKLRKIKKIPINPKHFTVIFYFFFLQIVFLKGPFTNDVNQQGGGGAKVDALYNFIKGSIGKRLTGGGGQKSQKIG